MPYPLRRRDLIAGLPAGVLLVAGVPAAAQIPAKPYLDYEARLRGLLRSPPGEPLPAMAAPLLAETNAFRRENRARALADDASLAQAALAHAADMAARGFFAHESPEGFTSNDRAGLMVRRLAGAFGENIAFVDQTPRAPTARQFFEVWRGSPGHRANMLKTDYTHAGHAAVRVGTKVYAAAVFANAALTLAVPAPFRLEPRAIAGVLAGAVPPVRSYMLSAPQDPPAQRLHLIAGPPPELAPGAWRLRPLVPRAGGAYDVLWGPILVV